MNDNSNLAKQFEKDNRGPLPLRESLELREAIKWQGRWFTSKFCIS